MSQARSKYKVIVRCVFTIMCMAFILHGNATASANVQTKPDIRTHFFGIGGATLDKLSSGGYGTGYIFYYIPSHGLRHPSLIVKLQRKPNESFATAEIYDVPSNRSDVPVTLVPEIRVDTSWHPAIIIKAESGWWTHGSIINYSLDVKIYEPMYAMWGEEAYRNQITKGNDPIFTVLTHSNADGIPVWDLRDLVPEFPGKSLIRSSYAESKETGPVQFEPSLCPQWPYVGVDGAFEQPNGKLVPPIVVDWLHGKIMAFSEIVTVRNENGSYDFYSITPIQLHKVNKPDFESPWGLYDLSGTGQAYPNLVIRNEHYYQFDPWSTGVDPSFITAPLFNKPMEVIRYSWRDGPGNQRFNYKVDVFGFHPYSDIVPIAGGLASVQAPPYASYPGWVIDKSWPATTFVDAGAGSNPTSEGIYDWSSESIGAGFWRGWTNEPDLSGFQHITAGLRGEYRIGVLKQALLYMSPLDNRLHLTYAQSGLWNIGHGRTLQEKNLENGEYVDEWILSEGKTVKSQVAELDGYIIEGDSTGVKIKRTNIRQSLFSILPPTNRSSWLNFQRKINGYVGKDPLRLDTWLNGIPGNTAILNGAKLENIQSVHNGFRLDVDINNHNPSSKVLDNLSFPSGPENYVFQYNEAMNRWTISKGQVAKIKASVNIDFVNATVNVIVRNDGDESWTGNIVANIGGLRYPSTNISIRGGDAVSKTIVFYPTSNTISVRVTSGTKLLADKRFRIPQFARPSESSLIKLSSSTTWAAAIELLLFCTALICSTLWIVVVCAKRSTTTRRIVPGSMEARSTSSMLSDT